MYRFKYRNFLLVSFASLISASGCSNISSSGTNNNLNPELVYGIATTASLLEISDPKEQKATAVEINKIATEINISAKTGSIDPILITSLVNATPIKNKAPLIYLLSIFDNISTTQSATQSTINPDIQFIINASQGVIDATNPYLN